MLVRRFIGKRLAEYYAQPSHKVVGRSTELETISTNSNLSSLLGEWHWKRYFGRVYEEREGHWLTPVELFQPHYSYVLGDFCAKYYDRMALATNNETGNIPLEIIELGGGRGTNAKWILSYLKDEKPLVYASLTSYTLVDSSPSLHKAQMEGFQNGPHADKVKFELKDLADVAQGTTSLLSKSNVPTVVMGMEVLDNLPHDKIRGRIQHKLKQAEVTKSANSNSQKYEEKFVPLSDPLLQKILKTVPQYYTQQSSSETDALWVPSIACGVLHHAISRRPNLGLVMADFDWLPPPDLDPFAEKKPPKERLADWAPIVTDMDGIDHASYLTAPPHCDILFPTDFEKLASFAKRSLPKTKASGLLRPVVEVEKQSEFLQKWGPKHVTKTKSWLTGHTPLLHDFSNCSVLTIAPQEQQ